MNLSCSDAEVVRDFYEVVVKLQVVLVWKRDEQIRTDISPVQ